MLRGAVRQSVNACAYVALGLVATVGCGSDSGASGPEATGAAAATMPAMMGSAGAPGSSASTAANTTGMTAVAPGSTSTGGTPPAGATPTSTSTSTATTPGSAAAGMADMAAGTTPADTAGSTNAMTGSDPMAADGMQAMDGAGDPSGSMTVELPVETGTPKLFWLEITSNVAYTAGADGSGQMTFASGNPLSAPDGVAVDSAGGHVFILNMGTVFGGANTGSLVRYDLDGSNPEVIMPPGSKADGETFNTGKQVSLDKVNHKLYLGDREGSKVWRCDLDGKNLEVLVSGHGIQQVVGVSPDPTTNQFYFSDRNGKKLFRASMEMPAGQSHSDRDDVELLYLDKAPNAMPLDIELDVKDRLIFWTDRQQNKVFSMSMDMPAGKDGMTRDDVKVVAEGLPDVIGLGYDHENKMLYATHSGSVSMFKADGSGSPKQIGSGGRTGITFAKIP